MTPDKPSLQEMIEWCDEQIETLNYEAKYRNDANKAVKMLKAIRDHLREEQRAECDHIWQDCSGPYGANNKYPTCVNCGYEDKS